MDRRVFLGWDGPLLPRVVEWLWARREEMPEMLVVVPTSQSGRRLREALAERGPCLAPEVVTPGWFFEDAGSTAMDAFGWVEALEGVEDWDPHAAVFPVPPGSGEKPGWGLAPGRSLAGVEQALSDNGLTIATAAERMSGTGEAARWQGLAALARQKENRLRELGLEPSGRGLRDIGGRKVVLAGVSELAGVVARRIVKEDWRALVAAPETEAGSFDELGLPKAADWIGRELEWPKNGEVELTADPDDQARAAVERVAEAGTASADLALGSADEETAESLVRAFGRAGWPAYNPAGGSVAGVAGWWRCWRAFLRMPGMATAVDLLGFPETSALVGGKRAQRVRAISRLRDRWLARDADDLKAWLAKDLRERDREDGELALATLEALGNWRNGFLRSPVAEAVVEMAARVDQDGTMDVVAEWVEAMRAGMERGGREAGFWLDLMIEDLPESRRELPDERVVDVQGWLELLHEPGSHLVVCGMNEGKVPGGAVVDPWLPERTRETLGLRTEASRAGRDAYLLRAMLEARRDGGRVDLLLAKSSKDGDALVPSRLLLAARGSELAERVKLLFDELEPPDAGLEWSADWKWKPPTQEAPTRLSVTAMGDYLACPFRFYVKHVLRASDTEPERVEWNARDFGNVAHEVLEAWGLNEEARDLSKTEVLAEWLHERLEKEVASRFGNRPPLAVRIQTEGLKQRLGWFARWQACERAKGWQVEEVERKFELELGGVTVVGKIDRVDRHEGGARRVLDYKTFKAWEDVEKKHRRTLPKLLPAHLEGVDAVLCETVEKGKVKAKLWTGLQVPLYALMVEKVDELGYLVVGASETEVRESWWQGFGESDLESAKACAEWVCGQVKAGVFWPPSEKVTYDDLGVLGMGRPLGDVVELSGKEVVR